MRILSRYVLREFLVPLGYCLTGFASIYVLFELFGSFSRMMEAHIPPKVAALYFGGYLAPYFHYLAPAALMLATLYTMWQFCRHSEIIAMRASGIGFLTIARPLLLVALGLAACVVWVGERFVPEYAHWAAQMKTVQFKAEKIVKADNLVLRNAAMAHTWNVDDVLDHDARHLRNVRVTFDRPNGVRLRTVEAARADWLDGQWWFEKPHVQHFDVQGSERASPTPEADALPWRCFAELTDEPRDFIDQNRPWKFNSIAERFRYLETHSELAPAVRREYTYDVWAQIMAPLACLIITLFAIPAGIASGRQSVFKGIVGAVGLYFAFYATVIVLMIVAKNGWINPIAGAVLPYGLFLVLGIRAFVRQR